MDFKAGCAVMCGIAVIVLCVPFVMAYPFMWLWNGGVVLALEPGFVKELTYWPAFCLSMFLCLFVVPNMSGSSKSD